MTLYYCVIDENSFITHDGYMQLGYHTMPLTEFLEKAQVTYIETNWIPDIFTKRYKRANYQKHLEKASIGTKDK